MRFLHKFFFIVSLSLSCPVCSYIRLMCAWIYPYVVIVLSLWSISDFVTLAVLRTLMLVFFSIYNILNITHCHQLFFFLTISLLVVRHSHSYNYLTRWDMKIGKTVTVLYCILEQAQSYISFKHWSKERFLLEQRRSLSTRVINFCIVFN